MLYSYIPVWGDIKGHIGILVKGHRIMVKVKGIGGAGVRLPGIKTWLLSSCEALGTFLNLITKPQFPHL